MTNVTAKDPVVSLREFAVNPARARLELDAALRASCDDFLAALLSEGVFDLNDPGFRYAITLLLKSGSLIPAVATPSTMSFAQALRLTRCVLELDNNFINSLLMAFPGRKDIADPACTLRVLDLVGECAAHVSNWRSLVQIHHDGDSRVRTKCAVLLARFRFCDRAGLERFRLSEPRVRANIIESLWGADRAKANALLAIAIRDEDYRVAGNACLALYHAGDTRPLVRLAEMLESGETRERVTAAWVIGKCRDSRFAGRLLEASRSGIPALRKHSIAAIAGLEPVPTSGQASASAHRTPFPLNGIFPATEDACICFVSAPEANGFEAWLHVTGQADEFLPHLRPIDFFVWSGEELLLDYSVEESPEAGTASLGIVYPAGSESLNAALRSSLAFKPALQSWALSAYGSAGGRTGGAVAPLFETDPEALATLLDSGPALSADAGAAVKSVLSLDPTIPDQHLVLVMDGLGTEPDSKAVRALCQEKKTRLHCWRFREILRNGGMDLPGVVRDEAQTALIWPRFVTSLSRRYSLCAKQMPTAVAIRNADAKPARYSARTSLLRGPGNE